MDITIYSYMNYVNYLNDILPIIQKKGTSLRALAIKSGFKSGNYIQLIVAGRRKLSERSARRLSLALGHTRQEQDYFALLARYSLANEVAEQVSILEDMKRFHHRTDSATTTLDMSMSSKWLFGVVYELAGSNTIPLTPETIQERLASHVSLDEIRDAIVFLTGKGYLTRTVKPGFYSRKFVTFQANNDVRRIEIQQSHLRYLDFAKHRLNDDVMRREFQGLTIGISKNSFHHVKERIRQFIHDLDKTLSEEQNIDDVIRVQLAAFYVTKRGES